MWRVQRKQEGSRRCASAWPVIQGETNEILFPHKSATRWQHIEWMSQVAPVHSARRHDETNKRTKEFLQPAWKNYHRKSELHKIKQ